MSDRLSVCIAEKRKRLGALNYRLQNTSSGAFKEMGKIAATIKNEEKRYDKKIEKITQKMEYWKDAPPKIFVYSQKSIKKNMEELLIVWARLRWYFLFLLCILYSL